jgi:DNA primase large subunit
LISLLTNVGVSDRELLRNVREDIGRQRYHIACNRVFELTHKNEIKKVCPDICTFLSLENHTNDPNKVKDENLWNASELDTILHPNEYFKRSFLLKNLSLARNGDLGVDGPSQGSN